MVIAWLEILLISVRCRDFFCSSAKSRAFSMAMHGLAGQNAQQLHVAFVENALVEAVHGHHADRAVVQNQRNGADRARLTQRHRIRAGSFHRAKSSRISSGWPVRTTYSTK